MWSYWLLFLVPAGLALSPLRFDKYINNILWFIVGLLGILLVGLRFEVGVDWGNYLNYLDLAKRYDLVETLQVGNANGSAYMLLNWVALQLGLGIYVVNLFCSTLLMVGIIKFCQKQPFPWLALAVAMPYLVAVVGMAYTRQAASLGLIFWGLSLLKVGNERKYFGFVILATLFHLSAIVNLLYMVLIRKKILWQYYLFFGLLSVSIYFLMIRIDLLNTIIIVFQYAMSLHSQGGVIRALMNVLPVLVSFFFWQRIKEISPDYKIIKWMSIAALVSIPLLILSTTLVDRFALYLIPLQVALWPRVIAVQTSNLLRSFWTSMILVYYGLVLFVWFNFAVHADWWLPYRLWPFSNEAIYPPPIPM